MAPDDNAPTVPGPRLGGAGAPGQRRPTATTAKRPPEGSATPAHSPVWTFADIDRFAELSGLPVVVKGVLRGDDAVRGVEAGAAAVWVSAHGGRQADPVIPSAHALPEVLTAVALGATAAFVGRPAVRGLATGGASGVSRVLAGLSAELAHTMTLCGLPDVRSVARDTVTPVRSAT